MDNISTPSGFKIGTSLSMWIILALGAITVRMEIHPWVNTVLLSVVLPFYMWYMTRNNIVGSISTGAMITTVVTSGLFMTLLLEARSKSSFSRDLKKHLKQFGKEPTSMALASLAIVGSLIVGFGVSYTINKQNFLGI